MKRNQPGVRLMPRPQDVAAICAFLDTFSYTREQYHAVYHLWRAGDTLEGNRWTVHSRLGGTYTMQAIMWYRFIHRPGTSVYRPSIILDALCRAIGRTE